MSQEKIKVDCPDFVKVEIIDHGKSIPEPKQAPKTIAQREAALRTGKVVSMIPYNRE